jgi:hypothetical protein
MPKQIKWGNIPMKGEEYANDLTIQKLTIIENRASKDRQSEGGKIAGKFLFENKKGLFAMSDEKRIEACKKGAMAQTKEHKSKAGKIGGKNKKDKGIPILMIDINTNNIIEEFPSIATAARFLNKSKTAENKIRRVANGERKTSYGFIWKYKK